MHCVRAAPNTLFHAAAARARGLAAACDSLQFRIVWAADMPAPGCARLRHVVNNRDVRCNHRTHADESLVISVQRIGNPGDGVCPSAFRLRAK